MATSERAEELLKEGRCPECGQVVEEDHLSLLSTVFTNHKWHIACARKVIRRVLNPAQSQS
jgi:hypothetical protein